MATATLCQAEELLRLCARDGCAMFAMEEDLFDANAMPAKEAAQFKLSADKQPRQLDTGSHSDNEDDDLLWCPSPTFPTVRAADPPVEMRPVATKPELSSSSNSNSSMCTFEAGVIAPDVARASQPTPPIPVPQSTSMEPKQSESVHQGSLFDPQAPQQQELQCSAPPTARAGAAPVQQFDDGSGSKVIASSAPAGLSNAIPAHLQEASHLEGGGRISPDLNPAHQQQQQQQQQQQHQQLQAHDLTCHTQQLQLQQPQQQQHQQAAPTGAAAAAAASSVVQHTRHTKRTPIPSVRLQRIVEGDAHASGAAGARSRPQHGAPRKRSGGSSKRGAEQDQAHGEHGAGAAQIGAHDSRRAKAARVGHHSGSSASASVSATPEPVLVPGASLSAEPSLAPSAFAWPEEGAPLLPDEAAWGGSASFGPAFARSGSSSSAAVIPSGMGSEGGLLGGEVPVFEAGMSASAPAGYGTHSLAGGVVHGGSHAMWVPTAGGPAVPASSGGGMALMGDDGLLPHDMHVTTDLLDVAAELAAAADKEGSGHGMRGSAALPTLMTAPPPQPVATYARAASTGTQRVRATGAGVPTQPRSRSRTGAAPRSKASAPPPLPRPDYDQHEDSEDGLPQVPPPRHPAGQPRGVPRAPARVLVPHPKGGCCTACKVAATPVWRTGPHGPKTLCNACGVRYTKAVTRKK